ncbi:GFA family protein [Novosphingobium huizhouense]|uniref:GFA family protein n=1 Tax=Novosphingobium huizhouense TaxID=2866625 RepID=UPI001CD84A6E|nr:GFA family protein [Novosphingobium huizhouense]
MAQGDTILGGCGCGAVRYRAIDAGMRPYACHCIGCQTRQGASFALNQQVAAADLVVDGETISGTVLAASGARVTHHACPFCLTRLYTVNERRPDWPTIRAGTRDDSPEIVPAFHVWVRDKQPWIVLPQDVPTFETQPEEYAWAALARGEGPAAATR